MRSRGTTTPNCALTVRAAALRAALAPAPAQRRWLGGEELSTNCLSSPFACVWTSLHVFSSLPISLTASFASCLPLSPLLYRRKKREDPSCLSHCPSGAFFFRFRLSLLNAYSLRALYFTFRMRCFFVSSPGCLLRTRHSILPAYFVLEDADYLFRCLLRGGTCASVRLSRKVLRFAYLSLCATPSSLSPILSFSLSVFSNDTFYPISFPLRYRLLASAHLGGLPLCHQEGPWRLESASLEFASGRLPSLHCLYLLP